METNLQKQQNLNVKLPNVKSTANALAKAVDDASLAVCVGYASKPLLSGIELPQTQTKTETNERVKLQLGILSFSVTKLLLLSFYGVLFTLWFVENTVFLNYEGGLIGFIADIITGFSG
jgi:hypothetical protein